LTDTASEAIAMLVAEACGDLARQLMAEGYEGANYVAAFDRLKLVVVRSVVRAMNSAVAGVAAVPVPAVANMNEPANSVRVNAASKAARPMLAPVVVTPPPDGAKALARKALAQSMLRPSAIAIGSQLIEHFNLGTGRCDPGTASLAASCGVSIRTVRRSVTDLVNSGLFGRFRHGGRNHANAYQPNWPLIVERAGEGDLTRPTLSADPDKVVTQNHLRKPDSGSMLGRERRRRSDQERDRRQLEIMMPIGGGREKSEEAVRSKLFGQLDAHLRATFLPSDKAGFAEGLSRSMDIGTVWQVAIKAEMQRKGDGLPVLLEAIDALGQDRRGWGGLAR
jgi:hypothetical protein